MVLSVAATSLFLKKPTGKSVDIYIYILMYSSTNIGKNFLSSSYSRHSAIDLLQQAYDDFQLYQIGLSQQQISTAFTNPVSIAIKKTTDG